MMGTAEPDAKQWIFSLINSLKHEDLIRCFVMLWAIWFARRKAIQSPLSTHAFVEAFLRDLEHVSASKKKARSPAPFQPVRRWIAPPSPRLLSELTGP
jgi:hypothetical protein